MNDRPFLTAEQNAAFARRTLARLHGVPARELEPGDERDSDFGACQDCGQHQRLREYGRFDLCWRCRMRRAREPQA